MKAWAGLLSLAAVASATACVGDDGYGPSYGYAQGPYGQGPYGGRPYYAGSRPYYPNYGPQYGPQYGSPYYAPQVYAPTSYGYGGGGPGFTLIASFPQGTVP